MNELTIIEQSVLRLIPRGSERKISIREIGTTIDLDERSIYEVVSSLRKKGVPVCAVRNGEPSNRGYYVATNETERDEGLVSYKAQIIDMQGIVEQIEQADLDLWAVNK